MAGMKSSLPTISLSVELFVLIFCFLELKIGNPRPKDNPPPVCPRILGWTASNASIHHFKIPFTLALRVSGILILPLRYCIRFTKLSQFSSSADRTLVVINSMAMQVSCLAFLVTYKVFATRLWNSTTFYWSSFLPSSFTTKIFLWSALEFVSFPFGYALSKELMISSI